LNTAQAGMRCVVRVAVATQPIRALFARERPPVSHAEWDEAAYVEQRLHAYAEALEGLALVQAMPDDGGIAAGAPMGDCADASGALGCDDENAMSASDGGAWFCCPPHRRSCARRPGPSGRGR